MNTLSDLKPNKGAVKRKKREGRGNAGYGGKTAGKGMNGQKSRKSPDIREQFEGGQTPLYRRLPKKQYMPAYNKTEFTVLNLCDLETCLEMYPDVKEITPEYLLEKRTIKKIKEGGLKILGKGCIKKAIKIKAHAFSESAKCEIEKTGGSVERI